MRPCVCGGSNENCCWCFGAGFIRDGESAPRWVSNPSSLRTRGRGGRPRPRKPCPICNALVTRLQRHINKIHNRSTDQAIQQNTSFQTLPAKDQQISKALPGSPQPRTSSSASEKPAVKRHSMTNCPFCHAQVREDRLQRHLSSRCPSRSVKGRNTRSRSGRISEAAREIREMSHQADSSRPVGSLRYKEGAEIESPDWYNNLDATKNIGYPVRESGRYGSHPSHDGFDDESEP